MKTVLVVEDTADYAESLKFVLAQAGYHVVVAADGRAGLAEAVRLKPALILMDLLMPEQDGVETTIKIRECDALKDIPIIFLTAVTASADARVGVNGRQYPAISKMLDQQLILAAVRRYMGECL